MGIMNEDVISCRNCGEYIVYEPANEKLVICSKCKAEHLVEHTESIKLLSFEGRDVYEIIDKLSELKTNDDAEKFHKYIHSITENEWYRLKSFAWTLHEFADSQLDYIRRLKIN